MVTKWREVYNKHRKMREQVVPGVMAAAFLCVLFSLTTSIEPGWFSWAVSGSALLVVSITALARVMDITALGLRWQVRRLGLILVGAGSVAVMAAPVLDPEYAFPTWRACALFWGMALTWLTTPGMPPWHKYIGGEELEVDESTIESVPKGRKRK